MASVSPASTSSTTQHRRIDLQSPLDLSYLLNNARAAARAKIDLHLPVQSVANTTELGKGDDLRKAVELSVDRYLEQTFEMVRLGVNVNGIAGEKVDWGMGLAGPEEFEPYDHELARRITSLHSTIEQLNLQLATTRQESVATTAQKFQEAFEAGSVEVDGALDRLVETSRQPLVEEEESLGFEDRREQTARIWNGATESLNGMDARVIESRQKAEGAERVVAHLEGR